jgi:predicted DNA-binding mobile mystery protein A
MKDIAYKHLDQKLTKLQTAEGLVRPARGWLHAVRNALGITTTQLAKRMDIAQSSVVNMEKAEQRSAITLETLEHAAEAMNCRLVYALVPNGSLEETIKSQATKVAKKRLKHVGHTMRLENQGVSSKAAAAEYARLVEELMRGNLHRLWDEE